jgi:hypothetical protein
MELCVCPYYVNTYSNKLFWSGEWIVNLFVTKMHAARKKLGNLKWINAV